MWWVWVVPAVAVGAALLAALVTGFETWRRFRVVRRALRELAGQAADTRRHLDPVTEAAASIGRHPSAAPSAYEVLGNKPPSKPQPNPISTYAGPDPRKGS